MRRWTTRPSSAGWRIAYPNLMGAVTLPQAAGLPFDAITNCQGELSGSVPPTWGRTDPFDLGPTLLFTQGASLNSYANFGVHNAFMNLGVNTPMTLIARMRWTGGKGGIAERTTGTVGWAWGINSSNRLMFLKRQSTDVQGRDVSTAPTSGAWHTTAVTYEGEAAGVNGGSIAMYLDGALCNNTGGNVRTGGGTNSSDAAAAFRVGNSSIDMPGVGNPTMAGSFGGNIAWIIGFHRVLSLAEIRAFSYTRGVPSTLWNYFGRHRRARFVPAPPPEDAFKIDGSTRAILQNWSISTQLNERGTMRFGVKSMDGSYRPGLREVIDFRKFDEHLFAGHIHHTDEGGLGGYGVVPIVTDCGATDYKALTDRRKGITTTLAAGTLKSQFLELAELLEVFGVTVDPAQVDGPSLPELALTNDTLASAIQKLSVSSGYAFDIDYDKVARMFEPGIEAAPFDIEDNDARVKGDVRVSPTTVEYGNHITVRFTTPAVAAWAFFTLAGDTNDGETTKVGGQTYTWKDSPSGPNDIQTGNAADSISAFIAAVFPAHAEVVAFAQSSTSARITAKEAGAAGNGIQVETTCVNGGWFTEGGGTISHLNLGSDAALTGVAIAEDVPAQDGGANLHEKEYEHPEVENQEAADALAEGYLAQSLVQPREIRYRTRLHGLKPGMQQQIQVTTRNVDGPCLIMAVDISPVGSALLNYDVTAVEGLVIVPAHQEQWRQMQGRVA